MADEPGGWELHRSLLQMREDMVKRFDGLDKRLDNLDARYVTRPEFTALADDVGEIKTSATADRNWKRTAMLTLGISAFGWLLTIAGLILSVVLR